MGHGFIIWSGWSHGRGSTGGHELHIVHLHVILVSILELCYPHSQSLASDFFIRMISLDVYQLITECL
jgi:hypothetical protein